MNQFLRKSAAAALLGLLVGALNVTNGSASAIPSASTKAAPPTTKAAPPTTTIPPVSDPNALKAVMSVYDGTLPTPAALDWITFEPWYGTPDVSNPGFDECSKRFGGAVGKANINWVLNQNSATKVWSAGIKLRVKGTDGRFLPYVISKYPQCAKFNADQYGWIIVPVRSGGFQFFGNSIDQWPKNAGIEVAQLSLKGVGKTGNVLISKPVNKRSGLSCGLIKTFGYAKESLKGAIDVIGQVAGKAFPGAAVAAGVVSVSLSAMDPPQPGDTPTMVLFTISNVNGAKGLMDALAATKKLSEISRTGNTISAKIIPVGSAGLTYLNFVTGIMAVNRDYNGAGC